MNGIKESINYIEQLNLDTPLLRCCAYYFGLLKKVQISFEEIENLTKDLNDYKNVAAIGYYSLSINNQKVIDLLTRGLDRISKKKLEPSNLLIVDDMAIFGLALSIIKLNLTNYIYWLKDIIFENNKFYYNKGNGFAVALEEYVKEIHEFSNKDLKYCAVKIWLENNINNRNNVLELQCEFAKEVWIKGVPVFDDEFYDLLAIGIINTFIDEKFKSGIVTNEIKYQRALKISLLHSKIISSIALTIITSIITLISAWFFYKIWRFEANIGEDTIEIIIKALVQILGIIFVPFGFYKLIPRCYKQLIKIIDSGIKKIRGLL